MTKIAFIGAGSLGFTRELVRDILTFPLLADADLALMDIDPERLDFSRRRSRKSSPGQLSCQGHRHAGSGRGAGGADVVLTTILAGGTEVWRHDIEIPKKYGVDTNVGDTRGPSGIFRFLRTINPMMDIVRDMERYCPQGRPAELHQPDGDAVRRDPAQSVHPDHRAVPLRAGDGANAGLVDRRRAGRDHLHLRGHQSPGLVSRFQGQRRGCLSADPQGDHRRTERSTTRSIVRNEMFLALGYYVTESSGHNSEYNWWFRKRPDLIEKYCTHGTGWNPGEYAYILKEYQNNEATWKDQAKEWFAAETPIDIERGHEYAAYIINALMGGEIVQVQRQRAEHAADHQPAAGCVRRSAGAGGQGRLPPDPRRRAAAAMRPADPALQRHRGDGDQRHA